MPFDIGQVAWEVGKIVGSAVIGFIVGRHQAKSTNHSARVQECQKNAIELIRSVSDDAVEHFSRHLTPDERIASSVVLKARLKRISTDSGHLAETVGLRANAYVDEHLSFHDAVTRYPFETFGATTFVVDRARVREISSAGEAYVAKIYKVCK